MTCSEIVSFFWEDRRFTMSELDRAAEACRVECVMAPYVEGVVVRATSGA